mgnify:CR=1 FL=1
MRLILAVVCSVAVASAALGQVFYSNFGGLANPNAIGLSTGPVTNSGCLLYTSPSPRDS